MDLYMDLHYHAAEIVALLVLGHDSIDMLKSMLFIVVAAHTRRDMKQSRQHACYDGP